MYREEVPGACFQNTLVRFRAGPNVDPDFALLVFRYYLHAGEFRKIARWSTNIAHLGLERFRAMPFPLPPMAEQKRIALEARHRLEHSALQKVSICSSLDRLPDLERELLTAAVLGQLVPQDGEDESAEMLLQRVGPPPREEVSDEPSSPADNKEGAVKKRKKSPARRTGAIVNLGQILRDAQRPLPLPELFTLAGYDRDQPEHVEMFYLALRSEMGRSIRQIGDASENATLEAIADAS
jgi:hypothetical protein